MGAVLKKRDYKSFGPVAKVRFRPMCEALGFEQTKPTSYYRERNGWFDFITLVTSQWGGNSFRIFWGIKPNKEEEGVNQRFWNELHRGDGKPAFWNRYTKDDIEKNATEALLRFKEEAEPLLQSFRTLKDIGEFYLRNEIQNIERSLQDTNMNNEEMNVAKTTFLENNIAQHVRILEWTGYQEEADAIKSGILPERFRPKLNAEKSSLWGTFWQKFI